MSSQIEALQRQITSSEDLSSIVRTMKALAATSVRQYEKAAESLDDYYYTVEMGLSVVLSSSSEYLIDPPIDPRRPIMMLVFGSDHGLAGRFNEQIVDYALNLYWLEEETKKPGKDPEKLIYSIGEQASNRISAAGVSILERFNTPSSINAVTSFIQLLLESIESIKIQEGVERLLLFYNRPLSGGFKPCFEELLPVSFAELQEKRLEWQSRSLPTFTMTPDKLLSALLNQYFFVSLYRACALSLAAENTSRLAAMQAAEKNINERLEQLKNSYQQARQAAITEELLDIVSGFRAVRGVS